jgi:hypothetical protein
MPNGTGTQTAFNATNGTDSANAVGINILATSTEVRVQSFARGTGAYVPMALYTSGSNKFNIAADATGTITIGGTAPRITGDFSNATLANRVMFQTSTTNGNTGVGFLPNGTSTSAFLQVFNAADPTNAAFADIRSLSGDMRFSSSIAGTSSYLPMTFYTGGSERMRLDTSGNVGIGTSTPTARLNVVNSANSGTATDNCSIVVSATNRTGFIQLDSVNGANGNSSVIFSAGGTEQGRILYKADSNHMYFSTATTERMRITSAGDVGIGTTAPGAKLEINGGALGGTSGNQTIIERLYGTVTNASYLDISLTRDSAGTSWVNAATRLQQKIDSTWMGFMQFNGTNNLGGITFGAGTSTVSATSIPEYMYLNSSGQVGIGTSAPTGKLDVRTAAGVVAQSNLYTGSNASVVKFNIGQVGAIDWDIGLSASAGNFYIGGLGGSMAEAYRITRTGVAIDFQTWNTGGSERMRIGSTGNVGIGTSTSTYGLSVNTSSGINSYDGVSNKGRFVLGDPADASGYVGIYRSAASTPGTGGNDLTVASYNTIAFTTGAASFASQTERMRIDSSGNVGIGTSSPSNKLDVSGTGTVSARVTSSSNTGISSLYTVNSSGSISGSAIYGASATPYGSIGANESTFYSSVSTTLMSDNASGVIKFATGGTTERMRIDSSGNVLVTNVAGLGYGTGSGGTVTQATSKSTAVTLNKPTGKITMNNASLVASGVVEFVFNNSLATNNDLILLTLGDQSGAYGNYNVWGGTFSGGGGFYINVKNISVSLLSDALVINFAIIKGAIA